MKTEFYLNLVMLKRLPKELGHVEILPGFIQDPEYDVETYVHNADLDFVPVENMGIVVDKEQYTVKHTWYDLTDKKLYVIMDCYIMPDGGRWKMDQARQKIETRWKRSPGDPRNKKPS